MPKYAQYDPTITTPQPVLGWYDTDEFNYTSLPQTSNLFKMTQGQWDARLSTPYIQNGTFLAAPAKTLPQVQQAKIAYLESAYEIAVQVSVSFTSSGGVTKAFQSDSKSQYKLDVATQGYSMAGSVPAGFYWVAEDNTRVPFTLADLKGLYSVMLSQGWTAFQNLRNKKDAVAAATTVAQVQAVVW